MKKDNKVKSKIMKKDNKVKSNGNLESILGNKLQNSMLNNLANKELPQDLDFVIKNQSQRMLTNKPRKVDTSVGEDFKKLLSKMGNKFKGLFTSIKPNFYGLIYKVFPRLEKYKEKRLAIKRQLAEEKRVKNLKSDFNEAHHTSVDRIKGLMSYDTYRETNMSEGLAESAKLFNEHHPRAPFFIDIDAIGFHNVNPDRFGYPTIGKFKQLESDDDNYYLKKQEKGVTFGSILKKV